MWLAFKTTHDSILRKTSLTFFAYTCLLDVSTFPLLVAVIPLDGFMSCVIGFS